MKGFHYLMKFGVFLNVLLAFSEGLSTYVRTEGRQGFVKTIWKLVSKGQWPSCEVKESSQDATPDFLRKQKVKFKYPPLVKAA